MNLILVGRVGGAFGVRGEVRISAYTQDPLALSRYGPLRREDGSIALTLVSARAAKDGVIARTREIDSKEAADALRGLRLFVAREALPPVEDEDDFYLADLIGLAACTPDGIALGAVKAVHNFGAGDLLELDPGEGRASRLVPFTREVAPQVLIAQGRIIVIPPTEAADGDEATPQRKDED